MAAATESEDYVLLKLLVNKESNKVVFAEAEKDFVDILCSFITLPLGTIARLIRKDSSMGPVNVGCLNSLYQSVTDLDEMCMWEMTDKEMLLQPKNSSEDYCSTIKINIDDTSPTEYFKCKTFFCYNSCHYLSNSKDAKCVCQGITDSSVPLKRFLKGFVNNVATFVITDDLIIMPNSMLYTSFSLLKNFGIITAPTKELTVTVTKAKALDLLKCALVSKSPLTDVFLGKKPSVQRSFFSCLDEKSNNIRINIQVVIRKSNRKILFAQGEQDFADLLLSFLTFPLGGIVRKLGGCSSLASIDGLYKSIVELDESKYLMSDEAKNRLVDPHLTSQFKSSKKILPIKEPRLHCYCYYQGENYEESIFHDEFFVSEECRGDSGQFDAMQLLENRRSNKEGYVKGPRTYLATDDLVIGPSSPISAKLLIDRMKVSVDDLKEKIVTIGMKECLSILKAALTSTSALTNGLSHLLTEVKEQK